MKKEKYPGYRWAMAVWILMLLLGVLFLIMAGEMGADGVRFPALKQAGAGIFF